MSPRTLVTDHAFPQLTHKASITLVLSDHLETGQETLYSVPVGHECTLDMHTYNGALTCII